MSIKKIIAFGSAKGGVGKSSITASIALSLSKHKKIGILDADVYGPNQNILFNLDTKNEIVDKQIIPITKKGIKIISMGNIMNYEDAAVWRGPMLSGAIKKLVHDTNWGELDYLLIDMPPGTGDVQLSLAQKTHLSGAVIVSTPQDVALLDARKGIDMFRQLNTPLLGMIENMSTHICSNCGYEEHIFGHGGVANEAKKLGIPLLAEIPLSLDVRIGADGGVPIVVGKPDSVQAKAFHQIAEQLIEKVRL